MNWLTRTACLFLLSASGVQAEEFRALFLGDSYTAGVAIETEGSWPYQLTELLRDQRFDVADPEVVAGLGWDVTALDGEIDVARPEPPYDLVTLQIGVNNHVAEEEPEVFAEAYRALLERAIGMSRTGADGVMAVTIPDWGSSQRGMFSGRHPGKLYDSLNEYNRLIAEATEAAGVALVDVVEHSRLQRDDVEMSAPDMLHGSAAQYALWVEDMLPVARNILKDARKARRADRG